MQGGYASTVSGAGIRFAAHNKIEAFI